MRPAILASSLLGGILLFAGPARAGTAWGDAALSRDDVRVELDEGGRATVTHSIGVHVSGKRFRAFMIDGIDDAITPPSDEATLAGRDGPGWPAVANDSKGQTIDAFIEPAKEPRKLRVRLGVDGVSRGDYTVQVRYHVDLAKLGAFARDGALTKLTWSLPRWPEGYDGAKVVFVVPAAKEEPRVSIADFGGDGEHALDGFALSVLHRGASRDEVEITRPHVAAFDDARFILRVDPKALPGVAASAAALAAQGDNQAVLANKPRARAIIPGACAAIGLLLAAVLRRRDRRAESFGAFRALIALPALGRAIAYGALAASAIFATWTMYPFIGSIAAALAIACATLRAPRPELPRGSARWLAMPESAIPRPRSLVVSNADPAGVSGRVIASLLSIATVVAIVLLRKDPRAALAVGMNVAVLLPLFLTGRAAQLPPDRVGDAWTKLEPIMSSLEGLDARARAIVRMAGKTIDEVRIRIEPHQRSALRSIEIGCGVAHGPGGATLVPELLVRIDSKSDLVERIAVVDAEDEVAIALGRSDSERVVCLRPAVTSPAVLRARIASLLDECARSATPLPEARAA
jgi:hypothetical protein